MFQVGDKIVHPMHGAGVIDSIVQKKINGVVREYYILKLPVGGMMVMIPTENSEEIGVRPVVKKDEADKAWKEARKALDDKVEAKYGELTVDEIKHLIFDLKWMAKLETDIRDEIEQVLNSLSSKVLLIAKRYEHTLGEIEDRVAKSRAAVAATLERMGYKW